MKDHAQELLEKLTTLIYEQWGEIMFTTYEDGEECLTGLFGDGQELFKSHIEDTIAQAVGDVFFDTNIESHHVLRQIEMEYDISEGELDRYVTEHTRYPSNTPCPHCHEDSIDFDYDQPFHNHDQIGYAFLCHTCKATGHIFFDMTYAYYELTNGDDNGE